MVVWRSAADGRRETSNSRPCYHCTKSLCHFQRKIGREIVVTFSTGDPHRPWAVRIPVSSLWKWNDSPPVFTFGHIPLLLKRAHSWVVIKEKFVSEIIQGRKKVENRPPIPKRGCWSTAPKVGVMVLLGIVVGANPKKDLPAYVAGMAKVYVSRPDASRIHICDFIHIQKRFLPKGSGFPGFLSGSDFLASY